MAAAAERAGAEYRACEEREGGEYREVEKFGVAWEGEER